MEAPVGIMAEEAPILEGIVSTEGAVSTEGHPVRRAAAPVKPAAPARKKRLPGGMPSMRSAVVWSEILGKPRALKGRR